MHFDIFLLLLLDIFPLVSLINLHFCCAKSEIGANPEFKLRNSRSINAWPLSEYACVCLCRNVYGENEPASVCVSIELSTLDIEVFTNVLNVPQFWLYGIVPKLNFIKFRLR